jgi:hypothetical protein
MKSASGIAAALPMWTLVLLGCSEPRPESVEFFQSMTGIPLCRDAKLSNFQVGEYDHETDFTYGVILAMSEDCEAEFLKEIEERLNIACQLGEPCVFMDSKSWSYEIEPLQDGRTRFVLRAI